MFAKILIILCLNYILYVESDVDVNTSSGLVRGQAIEVLNKTVNQFLGIPYAVPPLGDLRFARPQPIIRPIEGVIDAKNEKSSCLQMGTELSDLITDSEDCLVLNIWAPGSETTKLKPVMFWIHGGGLTSGSIFLPTYNGIFLATYDVVIVTVNYRLGAFGFLYGGESSAPGNVGFYDQLLALKWTRENIHLFGGDSNQITIFGESAGSWSVSAHVLSPLSRGLFKRAILESGAIFNNKNTELLTKDSALKGAKQMAKDFNCTEDNQWLECLRKVDAKALNPYTKLNVYGISGTDFLPLNAQNSFKTHSFSEDIDIMAGVMQNEGSLLTKLHFPAMQNITNEQEFTNFVNELTIPELNATKIIEFYLSAKNKSDSTTLLKAFYDFYGDIHITCPTYMFAKQFAQNSAKKNVFFYEWTYASHLLAPFMGCTEEMGVCHASEIEYVFGLSVQMNTKDSDFSKSVMELWTNFAKNGQPITPSNAIWPRIIESNEKVSKVKVINPLMSNNIIVNLYGKTCDGFWEQYFI